MSKCYGNMLNAASRARSQPVIRRSQFQWLNLPWLRGGINAKWEPYRENRVEVNSTKVSSKFCYTRANIIHRIFVLKQHSETL